MQLVECEFAHAGCRERIPRQELSCHMEEGAQHHLLSMSLLNLSLTKELHQKMAEKDQQITELQGQLQKQSRKLEEQFQEIKGLQEQITGVQGQLETKVAEQHKETEKQISGMLEDVLLTTLLQIGGLQGLLQKCKQISPYLLSVTGFTPPVEFTLTKFSVHKSKGGSGEWYSDPFYSHPGGCVFKLNIDTNGHGEARGTHISAYLQKVMSKDKLSSPVQVTAILQLLNSPHFYIGKCQYRSEEN